MPFTPDSNRHGLTRQKNCHHWDNAPSGSEGQQQLPFSDTVGFVGIDDSNDSFMQFASPAALPVPTFDDTDPMDWELARRPPDEDREEDDEAAVTFRSSPSEPARCLTTRVTAEMSRLASAPPPQPPPPPPTSSGELRDCRRASVKRPSPVPMAVAVSEFSEDDESDENCGIQFLQPQPPPRLQQQRSGGGCTPKRRRVTRPLGDLTNSTPPPPPPAQPFSRKQPAPVDVRASAILHRCVSEFTCGSHGNRTPAGVAATAALDSARVDRAIASIDSLNLIGNSEQRHSLPTVQELNYGIRHVTGATVSRLLNGGFAGVVQSYAIIDCRYPFEFYGGHIQGALNIYTQEDLLNQVFNPVCAASAAAAAAAVRKPVLIFHCEFSSERAPKLARFLRQRDREANASNYPALHFPEVYVLQGGYKAFYEGHKSDCQPLNYVKMADPSHKADLAHFQRASKAWERQNSRNRHTQLERMAVDRLF